MRCFIQVSGALLAFITAATTLCGAITPAEIPAAWFTEREHHAKGWKVRFNEPMLGFDQRFRASASAEFPADIKKAGHPANYQLIFRVSTQDGAFRRDLHMVIDLARARSESERIRWSTSFFLRPGSYEATLLVYENNSGERYLWRRTLKLPTPDQLPELDRNLPPVEFVHPYLSRAPMGESLPIRKSTPLRIDVVLNLTGNMPINLTTRNFGVYRQWYLESTLIAAAGVMSQLQPDSGCVRMSAIDILHLEVARDREPADPLLDWRTVIETLVKNRNLNMVDVKTLAGRTKVRQFFRQYLEKVIEDQSGCSPDLPSPERVIVVVSDSVEFPPKTEKEPVEAPSQGDIRFFHFRISPGAIVTWDQVGHMLHELRPRRFMIRDPKAFRKALAEMIAELEQPSGKSVASD